MDAAVQAYVDGIAPEYRPLFDRLHGLILEVHPDVEEVLSYNMPAYEVNGRRLHVGVWKHGVSSAGTIRLRPAEAAAISDDEFRDLARAALDE